MSESEQSVTTRAAILRTSQACQRCRSLKTRCLPSSQPGACQRCLTGGRDCAWADAPRRARKLRAPSRISQVEQKIDGLVASLVGPSAPLSTTDTSFASAPTSVEREYPSSLGRDPAPQPDRRRSVAAPGNWLPFSTSFEQRLEPPETPVQQGEEGEDAADRQYIEQIRSIHNFGDTDEHLQSTEYQFAPSKRREEPVKDDLVDDLLASGKASTLLDEYRVMSDSFPFVPLAPDSTAQQLCSDAPMLFLAIMTAASWKDHKRQMALDAIYRQELANRTIIRPRRNLGLVQSVLVYLSWYHFVFSHKTQQIFFLHHLVIGLALDIGLHRDFQPMFFARTQQKLQYVDPREKRERQRAFLGCYYLASMVSAALHKPNLLKHNSDMTEWAQELKDYGEFETDDVLGHLVALRQLDDEVQDTLFNGVGADARLTDARVIIHIRFLETRLDAWKRDSQAATCQRMLILSHSYTDMILHTVALRPLPDSAQPTSDGSHVKALLATLEAAKRFFDTLLSFPASDYYLISFAEWMRLPAAMMTVAKLCIPSNAHTAVGWDVKAAQDLIRLDICLEALCYRFQNHSTCDKAAPPRPDFWWAMRVITDLTRTWYVRKISPETTRHASTGPTPSSTAGSSLMCPNPGALPTPPNAGAQNYYPDIANTDFNNTGMDFDTSADGGHDPFAFMRSADFDMEQFFDMGIWSDDAYHGMGFGSGVMGF